MQVTFLEDQDITGQQPGKTKLESATKHNFNTAYLSIKESSAMQGNGLLSQRNLL